MRRRPTPEEIARDSDLIDSLGGLAEVARKLNLPEASGAQTVWNWKHRGIPPHARLAHPDLFPLNPAKPDKRKTARA
jgi:hypothetical protein